MTSTRSLKLVLLGAPGAGKGTQAKRITAEKSILHLSTGDMLREAVAAGSDLGRSAKTFMDAGQLVPDDVIIGMVQERIGRPDCELGFLLDGFPRTRTQAEALEGALETAGLGSLTGVISIEIDPEAVISRMSGRRVCRNCGAPFHVKFAPTKQEGVCDLCGGEVYQRGDDQEATVRERLKVYDDTSRSLKAFYEERGLLVNLDGSGSPDDVSAAVMAQLAAWS